MSIDLLLSLDPAFPSSVFGMMRIIDMGLLALSICILAVLTQPTLAREPLRQLGRLLLAIVILWAYLAFVELLIVWQSNLPNEASWYAPRLSGGWGVLAAAIIAAFFPLHGQARFLLLFPALLMVWVVTAGFMGLRQERAPVLMFVASAALWRGPPIKAYRPATQCPGGKRWYPEW